MPPFFWASAITCSASVVLPDDSGPKISMTRPRGTPPMPEGIVDADRAGRNHLDRGDDVVLAKAHDRALAELLFNLSDGDVERLQPFLSFDLCGMCVVSFRDSVDPRNAPSESQA